MDDPRQFSMPDIDADDIDWVCKTLKLHKGAFGDADRNDVLRSKVSVDVAACPGSGKTTLLVAKLAMLARKWPYRSRGICVVRRQNIWAD